MTCRDVREQYETPLIRQSEITLTGRDRLDAWLREYYERHTFCEQCGTSYYDHVSWDVCVMASIGL